MKLSLKFKGAVMLSVDEAIGQRRTTKVLAAEPFPADDISECLQELLDLAGLAPFHRACEEAHRAGGQTSSGAPNLSGIEPWRFHCLHAAECRKLAPQLDPEKAGKIPAMLRSASALILATWLPNRDSRSDNTSGPFEPTLGNMEHIAAASAAIQNLLLAATARGIANYWSSGGVLRSAETFQRLGISTSEILLGAIFLFPEDVTDAEVVGSKLRDKRTSRDNWSRVISLDS